MNAIVIVNVKKLVGILKVSGLLAPAFLLFDYFLKWIGEAQIFLRDEVLNDGRFMGFLFIALMADTVSGIIKHIILKNFSFTLLFTGFLKKVFVTFCAMILFNSITGIAEWEQAPLVRDYLILVGKLFNIMYVAGSAFFNIHWMTGEKFPPKAWMDKMKGFNETGKLSELGDKIEKTKHDFNGPEEIIDNNF